MNNIAISPHIFMYALQNQNVERKTAKQIDIKNLNHVEQQEINQNEDDEKVASEDTKGNSNTTNISDIGNIGNILPDTMLDGTTTLENSMLDGAQLDIQKID
jgi:hypothetical protein